MADVHEATRQIMAASLKRKRSDHEQSQAVPWMGSLGLPDPQNDGTIQAALPSTFQAKVVEGANVFKTGGSTITPPLLPVLPKQMFDKFESKRDFGPYWAKQCAQDLLNISNTLKELFECNSQKDLVISIPLIADHDCAPKDNGGMCKVSDLRCAMKHVERWVRTIRRLRRCPAYQRLWSSVCRRQYGMVATFEPLRMCPFEAYEFSFPTEVTIVPERSYELPVMTMVPAVVVDDLTSR